MQNSYFLPLIFIFFISFAALPVSADYDTPLTIDINNIYNTIFTGTNYTDTNASTACSDEEFLSGSGNCIPLVSYWNNTYNVTYDSNIDTDTNASSACSADELLQGDGSCNSLVDGWNRTDQGNTSLEIIKVFDGNTTLTDTYNVTYDSNIDTDTNATTECSGDEVLDGSGNCVANYNTSITWASLTGHDLNVNWANSLNWGNLTAFNLDVVWTGKLDWGNISNPQSYNATYDALKDTNASTACGDEEFLSGSGTCIALKADWNITYNSTYDANIDTDTNASMACGDEEFLSGSGGCVPLVSYWNNTYNSTYDSTLGTNTTDQIRTAQTDTNASTACSDEEFLSGSGGCVPLVLYWNATYNSTYDGIKDTNASTACSDEEILSGSGGCVPMVLYWNRTYNSTYDVYDMGNTSAQIIEAVNTTFSNNLTLTETLFVGLDARSLRPIFTNAGDVVIGNRLGIDGATIVWASKYGASLMGLNNDGGSSIISTGGTATLYVPEQFICDTDDPFLPKHEDMWLTVINSDPSYTDAAGEITVVVNSSCIRVSFGSAGNNTIVGATDMTYYVYPAPIFAALDNGVIHATIGENADAKFHIAIPNGTGFYGVHIDDVAGADQHQALTIDIDGYNYTGVVGLNVLLRSSVVTDGKSGTVLFLEADGTNVSNSEMTYITARVIGSPTDTTMDFANVDPDVRYIINMGSSDMLNQSYYNDTSAVINTTGNFTSITDNLVLFEADDSEIYLGSSTNFTNIAMALVSGGSKDIVAEYYYCDSNGDYKTLNGITDTTNGFQISGSITFLSPSDRGVCNTTVSGIELADGVNYSYIAIRRTANSLIVKPVESLISISGGTTNFILQKEGMKLNCGNAPYVCSGAYFGMTYCDASSVELLWCDGSSWQTFAEAGDVTSHDSLSGISGGSAGDYYHITQAQHTYLTTNDLIDTNASTACSADELLQGDGSCNTLVEGWNGTDTYNSTYDGVKDTNASTGCGDEEFLSGSGGCVPLVSYWNNTYNASYDATLGTNTTDQIRAAQTDTNSSTACGDEEFLSGSGTCIALTAWWNVTYNTTYDGIKDTNASTGCGDEEFLSGSGGCVPLVSYWNNTYNATYDATLGTNTTDQIRAAQTDTNSSTACGDEEFLSGSGICIPLTAWWNVTYNATYDGVKDTNASTGCGDEEFLSGSGGCVPLVNYWNNTYNATYDATLGTNTTDQIRAAQTDTNSSTACGDEEFLSGSGTCITLKVDWNITYNATYDGIKDTNASISCGDEEFLSGSGGCVPLVNYWNNTYNATYDSVKDTNASTTCGDEEILSGSGTCIGLKADWNITYNSTYDGIKDTNASTGCGDEEFLSGSGTCIALTAWWNVTYNATYDGVKDTNATSACADEEFLSGSGGCVPLVSYWNTTNLNLAWSGTLDAGNITVTSDFDMGLQNITAVNNVTFGTDDAWIYWNGTNLIISG